MGQNAERGQVLGTLPSIMPYNAELFIKPLTNEEISWTVFLNPISRNLWIMLIFAAIVIAFILSIIGVLAILRMFGVLGMLRILGIRIVEVWPAQRDQMAQEDPHEFDACGQRVRAQR